MMRRAVILVVATAVLLIAAVVGWDFVKLGRRVPQEIAPDERATSILVEKQKRRMTLLRNGTPIKTYAVSLGGDPTGHKLKEGDGRTPEGAYQIDFKNQRSRFHLALRISYPEAADREQARRRGVPPGGDIMIHGLPNGLGWFQRWHLARDWTDGCIAVTNAEIEEIWALVNVGTAIEIRP
jgi:murein L,D-transpeptidase YafK